MSYPANGFLGRVYYAAANNGDDPTDGFRLDELYTISEESERADDLFFSAMEALDASEDDTVRVYSKFRNAHEMQGFVNGFKLGLLLGREVFGP